MVMTYNSLIAQLTSYLNNTNAELAAEFPNFVYQAHQKICRATKTIGIEQYVRGFFTPNDPVIPKPGRWRRTITFNYGNGVDNNTSNPLYLRTFEYLLSYSPDQTQVGLPLYYSDYAFTHWRVAPTPDAAYPFIVGYLEMPEPISPLVQTNWLTNYAPDLLLYACLLEAIPYLKNDERIPVWESRYKEALATVNDQDDRRYTDRTSNRESD